MRTLLFIILMQLFPTIASAEGNIIGWFEPKPAFGTTFEFQHDKEVTIVGQNLTGLMDSRQSLAANSKICFANEIIKNDERCYLQKDTIIKNWSTNNITFTIPEDLFAAGTVKLRFERYVRRCTQGRNGNICGDALEWGDEYTVGQFFLRPIITQITNKDGSSITTIAKSGDYQITGTWFGSGKGNIYIGETQLPPSAITSWLHNKIIFNSQKFSGTTIRIQNGGSFSETFSVSNSSGTPSVTDFTKRELPSSKSKVRAVRAAKTVEAVKTKTKSSRLLRLEAKDRRK